MVLSGPPLFGNTQFAESMGGRVDKAGGKVATLDCLDTLYGRKFFERDNNTQKGATVTKDVAKEPGKDWKLYQKWLQTSLPSQNCVKMPNNMPSSARS